MKVCLNQLSTGDFKHVSYLYFICLKKGMKFILKVTLYHSRFYTSDSQYNAKYKYYCMDYVSIALEQYFHWSLFIIANSISNMPGIASKGHF